MLEIKDFSVSFPTQGINDPFKAVNKISLSIKTGERFALVGESGSGKTVTALSILNLLPNTLTSGQIIWRDRNLLKLPEKEIRLVRGNEIAMIFQEPMSALNPLMSIGDQIGEVLDIHEKISKIDKTIRVLELLDQTGIDDPNRRIKCFPHELSGGQRQRVLIAMALACKPSFLIADEPTTALDMTVRQQILNLLFSIQEKEGMSILLITHDLPLVERFAETVGVMKNGEIVELGQKETIFNEPQNEYTKKLLDSRPKPLNAKFIKRDVLVEVRNLSCNYNISKGLFSNKKFSAVSNENFAIYKGETLGVVGESGSGKTSLGMALLKLFSGKTAGQIKFNGIDLMKTSTKDLLGLRKKIQMVFQDPFSSLSPRLTIGQILEEGISLHFPSINSSDKARMCSEVMEEVGLNSTFLSRYPHEFSGGQRQRIAIARAIILKPELIVLDEPTSALDVSVQAQILSLLLNLQRTRGLTYLFISHDLSVIRAISHRILVMRFGKILEFGTTSHVLKQPRNEYTYKLMDAAFAHESI